MTRCLLSAALVVLLSSGPAVSQNGMKPAESSGAAPEKIPDQTIRVLMDQARRAMERGARAEAEGFLSEVVDLAYKLRDMENDELAESALTQVLMLQKNNPKALFAIAELYRQTNRHNWAVAYYDRYLAANPADPAAWFGRGTCYLTRGHHNLAIENLKYLIEELAPQHVQGLTNLAMALRGRAATKDFDVEIYKEAVEYMQRAVQAAENSTDEELKQMGTDRNDLKYRFALFESERQQAIAQSRPDLVDFKAALRYYDEAIKAANLSLLRNPQDLATIGVLASCYDGLGQIYRIQARLNPKDPAPYLKLSALVRVRAQLETVRFRALEIRYIAQAVKIDPNNAEAHARMAGKLANIGALKDAAESIAEAIKIEPDNENYRKLAEAIAATTRPAAPATQKKSPAATQK